MTTTTTYAEAWTDAINETYVYGDELGDYAENVLQPDDLLDGESYEDAEARILAKAAKCLRYGVPATFTAGELDLVRHLMPAHEVHQSYAVRWLLDNYNVRVELPN